MEPGAWLGNEHLQQHYLSANYTHVARDAMRRDGTSEEFKPYLIRMSLQRPVSINERIQQRLLGAALRDVLSERD